MSSSPIVRGSVPLSTLNVLNYGAKGDGVTDDSAAIQAAITSAASKGGGTVIIPPGTWVCNNVTLASGVTLRGLSEQFGYGPGSIRQTTLKNTLSGWCLDTPLATAYTPSVVGLNLSGPGSGVASGGIRLRGPWWARIAQVQIDNFANEAIQTSSASVACVFEDILVTNCVLNRTRATVIGAFDLDGSDHLITRVEINPGLAARSSANLYIAAIAIRGSNGFFSQCVGEFADVGMLVTGGSLHRFIACRADLNWGHGYYVGSGGNTFASCHAINNSQHLTNTYSGWYFAASTAQGNQLAGCVATSSVATVHKYGFEDLANYAAATARNSYAACVSLNAATGAFYTEAFLGSGISFPPHPIRPASGSLTVDVAQTSLVHFGDYAAPTTITNFINGVTGQTIRCIGNANVSLANNATIATNTGGTKTLAAGKVYSFTFYSGVWYEAA